MLMGDLPYMPFYVSDYEAKTAHLTVEEDGVYNRLLRLCWQSPGCTIPDDMTWIMRHMRVDQACWERACVPVIDEFFQRKNGRLFQKRQMQEYMHVSSVVEARKTAGSRGGSAKARKAKEIDVSKARVLPEQNPSKALASTSTSTSTEETPNGVAREAKSDRVRDALRSVLSDEAADAFIAHRKAVKSALTERAAALVAKKLQGHPDPDAVVEQSIMNGWTGIFPDKVQGKKPQSHHDEYGWISGEVYR